MPGAALLQSTQPSSFPAQRNFRVLDTVLQQWILQILKFLLGIVHLERQCFHLATETSGRRVGIPLVGW